MGLYPVLKGIHLTTVTLTLALFLVRSVWAFQGSARLRGRVIGWLPHVNDTVLFGSAFGTAATIGQYPFVNGWLTAKLLAMILYIVLGHFALWRSRDNRQRAAWMAAALAVFAYILMVARCHDPRVWVCAGSFA